MNALVSIALDRYPGVIIYPVGESTVVLQFLDDYQAREFINEVQSLDYEFVDQVRVRRESDKVLITVL